MAREFVALAQDPQSLFSQLQQWASANGFQLEGTVSAGSFRGTPSGLGGLIYGEIAGTYSVDGTHVTIRTNKNLPVDSVADRLSRFGLHLIRPR